MKTYYFNTGVKPYNHGKLVEGEVYINNELHIAFDCENVPENAIFKCLCDNPNLPYSGNIVREIFNTKLTGSKYAYFMVY